MPVDEVQSGLVFLTGLLHGLLLKPRFQGVDEEAYMVMI